MKTNPTSRRSRRPAQATAEDATRSADTSANSRSSRLVDWAIAKLHRLKAALSFRPARRLILGGAGLFALVGGGLLGGMMAAALAAISFPALFEGIGWLFLDRLPALLISIPFGLAGGLLLGLAALAALAGLWASARLWRGFGGLSALTQAWQRGQAQPAKR